MLIDEPSLSVQHVARDSRRLNPVLLSHQRNNGITVDVPGLLATHGEILALFEYARVAAPETLPVLARLHRDVQVRQQRMWGFAEDENHHLWYTFPRCTCPNSRNEGLCATPMRVIARDCPVHGREFEDVLGTDARIPSGNGQGVITSWSEPFASDNLQVVNVSLARRVG